MADPATSRDPGGKAKRAGLSAARLGAVQALYQMDLGGTGVEETVAEFEAHRLGREIEGTQYRDADADHFAALVRGVVREQAALDRTINRSLAPGWAFARMDATLRAILRAGAFELLHCPDVPLKVAISEYVDIAKAFFDEDEPKVTNAVLDRIAHEARKG